MTIREDYGLPRKGDEPVPIRVWGLFGLLLVLSLVGWLLAPDSAVTVVLLAVAVVAFVGLGVFRVVSSRQMRRAPGRDLRPPREP